MRKRLKVTYCSVVVLLILLAGRLAYIQLISGEEYREATVSQHKVNLEGSDERGVIYDRNLKPLTGRMKEYVFIIEKKKLNSRAYSIFRELNGRKVPSRNKDYAVYSCSKFNADDAEILEEEYNSVILETTRRYEENQPAVHLIGHINEIDETGSAGIEKDYENFLNKRKKEIYGVADAAGNLIVGQGIISEEENKDSGVVTTLDMETQKKAEEILKKNRYKGAAIVADVQSGGILASASWPAYKPTSIEKYLNSTEKELINRATQGLYPPGSVFKIVVAAAALEQNEVRRDTLFHCAGFEIVNGVRINCSKKEGHGDLTFQEAFAKSCNCVFIQTGEKIGGKKILDMAERFHLNEKILPDISNEKVGIFPEEKDVRGAGIGNLSIGQGTLLLTPIGVTRATMAVACGGTDRGLHVIEAVKDGKQVFSAEMKAAETKYSEPVFSVKTAADIKEMMKETALIGTARNLKVKKGGKIIPAAVKTGSAETSIDGEYGVHGWLTGFLPADNPKYVITVFAEGGGGEGNTVQAMFQELAESLNY